MAFATTTNTQKDSNRPKKDVDYQKMQEEIISIAKTQDKPKSVVGYITGVIDLGEQKRPDSEEEWKGTEEDERKAVAENPSVYFKNKADGKRYKCRPRQDCQQVAIVVDFPSIVVDKAKYFTDKSDPKPLRLILNGETSLYMVTGKDEDKKVRILQKGFSLTETRNDDGSWSFDKKNTLYKLADAAGIVTGGKFKPQQIDELAGKPALFQIRVYNKKGKDGKSYYTEEIKLAGVIPDGLPIPELDQSLVHVIEFDKQNSESAVKQLRQSVINTMARANNFAGSKLAEQLKDRVQTNAPAQQEKPKQAENPAAADFDDSVPF